MRKITIVRNTRTRTAGISARCGHREKNTTRTCMKPADHTGAHSYSMNRSADTRPPEQKKLRHVSAATKMEVAQMIEDPTYRKKLLQDLRARKLRPAVECMLWYYAKGKPKEMVEHSGTLSLQQELSTLTPEELKTRALEIAKSLTKPSATTVH